MMSRQRTFDLIPTTLVRSNGPKPPMTSKAAKKAHQLATRGPKVSKAEQRKRDAEELARQKKEYEREKAAAKAKAVREKRAAKEQADRELRKKNGLPEPSRFVRASQPTIFRFVKNGNKRTWLEMEPLAEESGATIGNEEPEEAVDSIAEPETNRVKKGKGSEDEYGAFPSFSQSELGTVLAEAESPAKLDRMMGTVAEPSRPKSKGPAKITATPEISDEFMFQDTHSMDDMAATQLLLEAADAATRSGKQQRPSSFQVKTPKSTQALLEEAKAAERSVEKERFSVTPTMNSKSTQVLQEEVEVARRSAKRHKPLAISPPPALNTYPSPALKIQLARPSPKQVTMTEPPLQERSINMAPPPLPLPSKEKKSISFTPCPPKPQTLPHLPPQPLAKPTPPPSSTQVFIESHLDDFFPSPSQEVRELLDDVDHPSNTQIASEVASVPNNNLPPYAPQADYFADLICTQDLVLSSQDLLEITTPCPPPSRFQGGEKMGTPTPTTTKTRQPRRRFFEEKDEDLLHAAILESKVLATKEEWRVKNKPSEKTKGEKLSAVPLLQNGREIEAPGMTKRAFSRTLSSATDYGDEFHDCEEELLALC